MSLVAGGSIRSAADVVKAIALGADACYIATAALLALGCHLCRMYIDFHVPQTVPPSCVNRDDTGSPKTAVYGGVNRARVSSQAWKRAMRILFEEDLLDPAQVGKRTKNVVEMVAEEIALLNPALNCAKLAEKALKSAGKIPELGSGWNSIRAEPGRDTAVGILRFLQKISIRAAEIQNFFLPFWAKLLSPPKHQPRGPGHRHRVKFPLIACPAVVVLPILTSVL